MNTRPTWRTPTGQFKFRTYATTIALGLAGLAGSAQAQVPVSVTQTPNLVVVNPSPVGIPNSLKGVKLDPEIPYIPGASIGPLGPIVSLAEDADYIQYATDFWAFIDSNGTNTNIQYFFWSAPEILNLFDASDGSAAQVDEWGGGFTLFREIYLHRLFPNDPAGPKTIYKLVEQDSNILYAFKHWTHYHQLITDSNDDPVAHQNHVNLALDALNGGSQAAMRGVPYYDSSIVVTDRLEILQVTPSRSSLGAFNRKGSSRLSISNGSGGTGTSGTGTTGTDGSVQGCIDNHAGDLAGIGGLYKPDEGYSFFGLTGGEPGFDCDDFADAIGAKLTKGKKGASYSNIYCSFTSTNPTNGKKAKGAHLITRVDSGGQYWLVDAQTGDTSGPHSSDTPMDAGEVLDGYNPDDGSVNTDQTQHPPGDRSPWQGTFSGEPDPWYTSPGIVECFESLTGEDSGGYTL